MYILRPSDYRRMPWKNGGGETIEIAIAPPSASVDDFDWRISMARVEADGAFSSFPGVDRTLAILDGEGIRLTVGDAAPIDVTGMGELHGFAADVATFATLISGPVLDFNVMTRRAAFWHRLTRIDLASPATIQPESGEQLLFCTRGRVEVAISSARVDLGEGETLHRSGQALAMELLPEGLSTVFSRRDRSEVIGASAPWRCQPLLPLHPRAGQARLAERAKFRRFP